MKRPYLCILTMIAFLVGNISSPLLWALENPAAASMGAEERLVKSIQELERNIPQERVRQEATRKAIDFAEPTASDILLAQNIDDDPTGENKIPDLKELKSQVHIESALDHAKDVEARQQEASKAVMPKKENETIQKKESATSSIIDELLSPDFKEKRVDLDFDETRIEDITRMISETSNLNIVLDPTLKGKTLDLHLKQVTIPEALSLLGDSYDWGFKKIGQSLFVTTKEKIKKGEVVNKVIKLRNIDALAAKALTNELLDVVNVNEQSNSLVLVGTPEEIKAVEEVLMKVDVPQPQVVLEARVIEVNKDALKDLGVDWSDAITAGFQESSRPTTFDTIESAGRNPFHITSFQRSAIQFDAVIKMLESSNKAKVLSNPRVITVNNQQAEIFVGDRIPYTITTVTGGVATTEVRFVEPGIRLKITPSIIGEDFVVIKVEPEVSFIFSFRGPQDQYPWVKTRNATAYVRVKNNQPFVLGGLLNQEDKKNLYKVPMLGNIPVMGKIFSYEKHSITNSELIITVTPAIINSKE